MCSIALFRPRFLHRIFHSLRVKSANEDTHAPPHARAHTGVHTHTIRGIVKREAVLLVEGNPHPRGVDACGTVEVGHRQEGEHQQHYFLPKQLREVAHPS